MVSLTTLTVSLDLSPARKQLADLRARAAQLVADLDDSLAALETVPCADITARDPGRPRRQKPARAVKPSPEKRAAKKPAPANTDGPKPADLVAEILNAGPLDKDALVRAWMKKTNDSEGRARCRLGIILARSAKFVCTDEVEEVWALK